DWRRWISQPTRSYEWMQPPRSCAYDDYCSKSKTRQPPCLSPHEARLLPTLPDELRRPRERRPRCDFRMCMLPRERPQRLAQLGHLTLQPRYLRLGLVHPLLQVPNVAQHDLAHSWPSPWFTSPGLPGLGFGASFGGAGSGVWSSPMLFSL